MTYRLLPGDNRATLLTLPDQSVQTCITSPPYFGLRDYGMAAQIGLEPTPERFIAGLVEVFRLVRRVLKDDGTLWVNIADSYNAAGRSGHGSRQGPKQRTNRASGANLDTARPNAPDLKKKDLIGIPWMLAFALRADGWHLRQDIIWAKPNPMPESVKDRCTKSHEYIFLFSKGPRYYYNADAIQEPRIGGQSAAALQFERKGLSREHVLPGQRAAQHRPRVNEATRKALRTDTESRHRSAIPGGQSLQADPDGLRNKRSVWTVATAGYEGAHFATYPPDLILPCVLAGSHPGDVILDPFAGSGTTGEVAILHGRYPILCELNPSYGKLIEKRCEAAIKRVSAPLFDGWPPVSAGPISAAHPRSLFDL